MNGEYQVICDAAALTYRDDGNERTILKFEIAAADLERLTAMLGIRGMR